MPHAEQLPLNLDDPYAPDRSALNEMFRRSEQYRSSREYKKLMEFIARFPRYSPYNCALLFIQNPEVTYTATPNQWQKRFQRRVKPGARPLLILAPNCPVLFVYDLADTEGEALPEAWQNPFEVRGRLDHSLWQKTIENCRRDGIFVNSSANFNFLHAGTAFRLRGSNQLLPERPVQPFDFLIAISKDEDLPARYATLAHELGHIYSGHLGSREGDNWPDRRTLTRNQEEVEAESIAYLVCHRRGIATRADEYLALYFNEDCQMPEISLETILKVATRIERMAEELIPERTRKNKPS